jgi:hypothetical protein
LRCGKRPGYWQKRGFLGLYPTHTQNQETSFASGDNRWHSSWSQITRRTLSGVIANGAPSRMVA